MDATRLQWSLGRISLTGLGYLLLFNAAARAQFTADYQTNTIDGVVSNWVGDYIVGSNTVFDQLQLINGGALSNGYAKIGENGIGSGAIISGNGLVWSNRSGLTVGRASSSDCYLIITNGGKVFDSGAAIGIYGGSNATALVSGSGSVWSNRANVIIGGSGSSNRLVVMDGGVVFSSPGSLSSGASVGNGSSNNTALIAGNGSVWSNSSVLFIGNSGNCNSLVISNGAMVVNAGSFADCYIGDNGNSNSVVISDTGSVLSCRELFLGSNGGSGNRLVISNGANVLSLLGFICYGGSSNNMTITGDGSVWNAGELISLGQIGMADRLIITDGGTAISTRGAIGLACKVEVSGTGSVWGLSDQITVGYNVGDASLIISNFGTVLAPIALVYPWNQVILNGGTLVATNRLQIMNQGLLTGCGTINATVLVDTGGTVLADCGAGLAFADSVTNNGTLRAGQRGDARVLWAGGELRSDRCNQWQYEFPFHVHQQWHRTGRLGRLG